MAASFVWGQSHLRPVLLLLHLIEVRCKIGHDDRFQLRINRVGGGFSAEDSFIAATPGGGGGLSRVFTLLSRHADGFWRREGTCVSDVGGRAAG